MSIRPPTTCNVLVVLISVVVNVLEKENDPPINKYLVVTTVNGRPFVGISTTATATGRDILGTLVVVFDERLPRGRIFLDIESEATEEDTSSPDNPVQVRSELSYPCPPNGIYTYSPRIVGPNVDVTLTYRIELSD